MSELRTVKCTRCRMYRKQSDFFRRNKDWKTCNTCSKWKEKKEKYISTILKKCKYCKISLFKEEFIRKDREWKTCNMCRKARNTKINSDTLSDISLSSDNESSAACPPDFFN